jgi:hypothetical protein
MLAANRGAFEIIGDVHFWAGNVDFCGFRQKSD